MRSNTLISIWNEPKWKEEKMKFKSKIKKKYISVVVSGHAGRHGHRISIYPFVVIFFLLLSLVIYDYYVDGYSEAHRTVNSQAWVHGRAPCGLVLLIFFHNIWKKNMQSIIIKSNKNHCASSESKISENRVASTACSLQTVDNHAYESNRNKTDSTNQFVLK